MRRSRIIILSVLAIVMIIVIIVLSVIYNSSRNNVNTVTRSNNDYVTAITKSVPGLLDNNNQPIFTIESVTKLDTNWYMVLIKSNQNSDTLRALIFDSTVSTDTVSLVLGPSISFDKSEIPTNATVPSSVYQELVK